MGEIFQVEFGVLIAAAGSGKRMGTQTKKQYLSIGGKPLLIHTIEAFNDIPHCNEKIVVTAEEDLHETRRLLSRYLPESEANIKLIAGGSERQESVRRGLKALENSQYVMIHDGARPFVTKKLIHRVMNEVLQSGSTIPGLPVKNTIKQVNPDGWVDNTPPRNSLWAVQTPQAFRLSVILDAHEKAGKKGWEVTDDAMLLEKLGQPVKIIMGEEENIKITTKTDLLIAELIIKQRKKHQQ